MKGAFSERISTIPPPTVPPPTIATLIGRTLAAARGAALRRTGRVATMAGRGAAAVEAPQDQL